MECRIKCLMCNNSKKHYVNYSRFHGVCGNENLATNQIFCIHCKSLVPVLKLTPIDSSSNLTSDSNSQEIFEMRDSTILSSKKSPLVDFFINKELINAFDRGNLDSPFNVDNGPLIKSCGKQENLLFFNEIQDNYKLFIQSEALDLSQTESKFDEIIPNTIKEDDFNLKQESNKYSEGLGVNEFKKNNHKIQNNGSFPKKLHADSGKIRSGEEEYKLEIKPNEPKINIFLILLVIIFVGIFLRIFEAFSYN